MSFIFQPVTYPIPVPAGLIATGTPSASTYLDGAGNWSAITVAGSTVYEWQNLSGDAAPLGEN